MRVMKIHSNIRDYQLFFDQDAEFLSRIKQFPARCVVVDENVWRCHAQGLLSPLVDDDVVVFPVSEERKNLQGVCDLYDLLLKYQAKRNLTLISIGGGILQDITGFVASTLYRGLNWIFVPTTLLAQADSCIGSKTSLNYKGFKNTLGTFCPPAEIFLHTPFLHTQQKVDFFSGLGEVVKLHLMGGEERLRDLRDGLQGIQAHDPAALLKAVEASLQIKLSYIAGDEFDSGRRNLLNFGHCFGHAIETASDFEIPHGQAVVLGMILANAVSCMRGQLSEQRYEYLNVNLLLPVLAVRPKRACMEAEAVIGGMKNDKKRIGAQLPLVMLKQDNELVRVNDLTEEEVSEALRLIRPLLEDQ